MAKILIIDNNESELAEDDAKIREEGHAVFYVKNMKEALQTARREQPEYCIINEKVEPSYFKSEKKFKDFHTTYFKKEKHKFPWIKIRGDGKDLAYEINWHFKTNTRIYLMATRERGAIKEEMRQDVQFMGHEDSKEMIDRIDRFDKVFKGVLNTDKHSRWFEKWLKKIKK